MINAIGRNTASASTERVTVATTAGCSGFFVYLLNLFVYSTSIAYEKCNLAATRHPRPAAAQPCTHHYSLDLPDRIALHRFTRRAAPVGGSSC